MLRLTFRDNDPYEHFRIGSIRGVSEGPLIGSPMIPRDASVSDGCTPRGVFSFHFVTVLLFLYFVTVLLGGQRSRPYGIFMAGLVPLNLLINQLIYLVVFRIRCILQYIFHQILVSNFTICSSYFNPEGRLHLQNLLDYSIKSCHLFLLFEYGNGRILGPFYGGAQSVKPCCSFMMMQGCLGYYCLLCLIQQTFICKVQ